ncbi:phage terminase small subunit [Megasphaera sueciensis]|uniref:phage terminase small subunit n=1 Tax=Megasphaera sueciensis TaxID=349094 RepID=UPI003CFDCCEC
MELRDKAYNDYLGGMKYKEIAEKYGVSINTVKSWKQRHNWQRKKGAHKKKKGAPFCNTNSVGHASSVPKQNSNAVKHGLFAKYLPPETAKLVQAIEKKSPIDILWENICIKYAAIIRAQKIMYVTDSEDLTRRHVMESEEADTYQYTEAYEKQAAFLMAQSRAMGTLNNMIKQYEELCRAGQADEEQRLRIQKLKAEVDSIKNDAPDKETVTFTFDRKSD